MKQALLILLFSLAISVYSQQKINWINIEKAMELYKTEKKPILIDMYTNWCGWCKTMDTKTFSDTSIARYINQYFYAVKFNAETTDQILFQDSLYKNNYFGKLDENGQPLRTKSHSLAEKLLYGRMSYPTIVYMVPEKNIIAPVPGYMSPKDIEPLLLYFGNEVFNMNLYEAFTKGITVKKIVSP